MALVPHWRRVLRRAWSVHFSAAAIATGGLYVVLDALDTYWFAAAEHMNPVPFIAIGTMLKGASVLARIFYQPELHK